jgi:hypothetical protein
MPSQSTDYCLCFCFCTPQNINGWVMGPSDDCYGSAGHTYMQTYYAHTTLLPTCTINASNCMYMYVCIFIFHRLYRDKIYTHIYKCVYIYLQYILICSQLVESIEMPQILPLNVQCPIYSVNNTRPIHRLWLGPFLYLGTPALAPLCRITVEIPCHGQSASSTSLKLASFKNSKSNPHPALTYLSSHNYSRQNFARQYHTKTTSQTRSSESF